MSVPLSGYSTTRLLHASTRAAIYEAERKRDGQRVLAKVFDVVDEGAEARVEHEFRLLQQLDVDGVVRALGIERAGRQVVLLLEYVPGHNLAQQAGGEPVAVSTFVPQAQAMASTLAQIHERRIIHRDIKPSNVLVEEGTGKIVFADFGISVLLEDEQRRLHDPEVLQGTLPYVSPEQTGRTRREVDFRSDLYSLGVTFYELLTGRRPFESMAPLELIHAHLAQRPQPPHELIATIPAQLSAIVMKLLEKAPEHRYQSARGLAADLDRLAEALAAGERDPEFRLAEHDYTSSLQLPHQLYGREREREVLDRELTRVIESGDRRLVLLSGEPGSGKTSLIRSFDALLNVHHGYIGVGKFEQRCAQPERGARTDVAEQPYRGFAEALASVVAQILTESDEQLAGWRTRLRATLGPIAGVVGVLVPELALVIGPMTPVPEVELGEARNRLHLALARFVEAIAEVGPLVLVLDDLQWADPGSLELLAGLMLDSGAPVLVVGAYRRDAVDELHPLEILATELDSARLPVTRIELRSLSNRAVEDLLVDLLGRSREQIVPLAEVIARKTDNNPLFVRQYLIQLADLGLLRPGERGWVWELDGIASAVIPDDLLGVMRAKLERLPERERELLQIAACIGARFELGLLEAVGPLVGDELVAALYELEMAGLIGRSGGTYQFSHNGIQEAARAGLDIDARRRVHAEIAARLLEAQVDLERGEAVFAIVDQLDQSVDDIDALAPEARERFARLNIEAGVRALHSAAWRSSLGYLELATRALGSRRDALGFEAQFGLAQAQALAGDSDGAAKTFDRLLGWELSIVDYGRVVARRVRILQIQDRLREALDYGRVGLERCGVRIPISPSLPQMFVAVVSAWRVVKGASLDSLLALPDATDERAIATMLIVTAMKSPALFVDQNLFTYLTALHARLTMTAGFHSSAVEGLAQLGVAAVAMGQVDAAVRLVDDLVELGRRRETTVAAQMAARTVQVLFVGPSGRPIRESAMVIEDGFNASMEAGDRLSAGYLAATGLWLQVEAGVHLGEVHELAARLRRELPNMGSRETLTIADTVQRFVATISAEYDEQPPGFLPLDAVAHADVSATARYAIVVAEVWGQMLLADHERARELMDSIAYDYEKLMFGFWAVPRAAMLDAILTGERARAASRGARRRLVRRMQKRLATARRWAKGSAENYGPMVDVILGELAWADGDARAAVDAFERASSSAADSGRSYLEVFACLRLAALAEEQGWATTRQGALTAAHAALSRWGAWAIVARLEREHPELGASVPFGSGVSRLAGSKTGSLRSGLIDTSSGVRALERSRRVGSGGSVYSLDLATVLGTMQVISEDLRLEEVITRVLGSAIENAGADRGALLLERGGGVVVVALGTVDANAAASAHGSPRGTATAHLDEPIPLREAGDRIPTAVVNYVLRTGDPVVVDDAREDARFAHDDYVARSDARSLLCMPIVKQSERVGALVLENHLTTRAFTEDRLETLEILLGQAASALDNARLYAQLERSEAQWRSLVDGVPDIIVLLDERGRVEFINHLASSTDAPDELIGLPVDTFVDASSAEAWRTAFAEVVATGKRRELEICAARPGAQRRWFMTRIAAIQLAGQPGGGAGKAERYLSIWTDVTARKGLETQLRQQQRLDSVGTLASGVAHEINNPVQGILNYAELISERARDSDLVREFAGEIAHESNRVAAIVRNLLAFSRQEADQRFEHSKVGALIEDTLSLVRAVLRKDQIAVEVDVPDELPQIRCRVQQIQQILMNLVTNARDALNERYEVFDKAKRIRIRARAVTRGGRDWVRISVEDRAGGIPEDIRARIFDPFFTTKGRDQGTGLGLAVSHGIAADHDGELSVESELGFGSTFHLDLPVG